ncbi:MAG: hypothetical protein GY928_32530 [Colwellia sp.]|nr:hypothetical protein [Colwellia sp.]
MNSNTYVKPYIVNNVVCIDRQAKHLTRPYEVPLEQVKTLDKLIKKQCFLKDKTWYTDQMNDDFFEVVITANGW